MARHLLYKKASGVGENLTLPSGYTVQKFTPTLKKLYRAGERKSLKITLTRLNFVLSSRGKTQIIFLLDEGDNICHSSFVIPKIKKFPFMKKGDYQIGPCVTSVEHRGKGLYPFVINYIVADKDFGGEFYMIVADTNTPSIKGIEKAGFKRVGNIKKTKLLKRYVLQKD